MLFILMCLIAFHSEKLWISIFIFVSNKAFVI